MTGRVVCLGDVMVDVVARLPGPLAHGSDTPAPVKVFGGGSAANTAAWLACVGSAAAIVATIGDDPNGVFARDDLARYGLDLDLRVDPDLPTGTCIVLVDVEGERTMIPSAGANAAVLPELPEITGADLVHLSGYVMFRAESLAGQRLAEARAAGCRVSVDAASAAPLRDFGTRRFLADAAPCLLFANRDEAAVLCGTRDVEAAARALGLRCGEAIVKNGADGAVWSDGHEVIAVPAVRASVVDSTGAGDAFAAGVLAARLHGEPITAALAAGTTLAASAVTFVGARPPAHRPDSTARKGQCE